MHSDSPWALLRPGHYKASIHYIQKSDLRHVGWQLQFKWAGNQEAVTFLGYRPIRS
jgi:hypothetical protein